MNAIIATTTNNNSNNITACDNGLDLLANRVGNLPELINNIVLLIVRDPANLAGRSVRLLTILSGMRCQKNVYNFFCDFLPNSITVKAGIFTLGKKRHDFIYKVDFDSDNLPYAYRSPLLEAKKAEKIKAKKAEKAEKDSEKRKSQVSEQETILERTELKQTIAAHAATIAALMAENAALKAENSALSAENAALKAAKPKAKAKAVAA
jgi:hypothetical protein